MRGRKPLPADERKQAITLYLKSGDIKTLGGSAALRTRLNEFITSIKTKQNEQQKTLRN